MGLEDLGWHGFAEKEPLGDGATAFEEHPGHDGVLDPLGDRFDPQRPPELHDGPDDEGVPAFCGHVGNETAVDRKAVDRQFAQLGHGGVARPEVVDGQAHSAGAELPQHRVQGGLVKVDGALGYFQVDVARENAGFLHHPGHHFREAGIVHATGRDVDGHPEVLAFLLPSGALGQGVANDPLGDGPDELGLFGQGNELVGIYHPGHRVAPPDQRLDADHVARRQADLRLVLEEELVSHQGLRHVGQQADPSDATGAGAGLEHGHAFVGVLGRVHGLVGPPQERRRVGGVVGQDGHPEAGRHRHREVLDHARLQEGGLHPFGYCHRRGHGADVRQDDSELVAS